MNSRVPYHTLAGAFEFYSFAAKGTEKRATKNMP